MSSNEKSENFNPQAIYSKVLTELLNVVVDYINDLAFSRISKKKITNFCHMIQICLKNPHLWAINISKSLKNKSYTELRRYVIVKGKFIDGSFRSQNPTFLGFISV